MAKDVVLIVGLGEVGQSLYEIIDETEKFDVYGLDADQQKQQAIAGNRTPPTSIDVMHICFGCAVQEKFQALTVEYIKKIQPKLTIIDSTVPPGTTQNIFEQTKAALVHSPIQGMHKTLETMKSDIKFWNKYVGPTSHQAAQLAKEHFEKVGLTVKVLAGTVETELSKLYETVYMAWMITFFQEAHRAARKFGADFEQTVEMIEDIQRAKLNKPLQYPAFIGGHCLIPNTKLLLSVYDSDLLRDMLKSNEKRQKEMQDPSVAEEVEKIKKRSEKLQQELLKKLGS
ncbi:MAG: GDP-mannose dehydrogenase [Candidatus Bathyarchaeota archaeon]|nr:GDP-mannose dehydrogenase [Candidatus Bathyarchaeota archaeon]